MFVKHSHSKVRMLKQSHFKKKTKMRSRDGPFHDLVLLGLLSCYALSMVSAVTVGGERLVISSRSDTMKVSAIFDEDSDTKGVVEDGGVWGRLGGGEKKRSIFSEEEGGVKAGVTSYASSLLETVSSY